MIEIPSVESPSHIVETGKSDDEDEAGGDGAGKSEAGGDGSDVGVEVMSDWSSPPVKP